MTVELTPNGTRGMKMPKLPKPVVKVMFGLFAVIRRLQGMPMLALTTTGARTGNQHTVQLRPFPDGENAWLIVASFGGAAKHPAWFVNMAKNPDKVWAEIGSRKLKVRPVSLTGAEREQAWARITAAAPSYAEDQRKTDREIPIVRLTAEA